MDGLTSARHHRAVSSSRFGLSPGRPWTPMVASLVPWAAFLLAATLARVWADGTSLSRARLVAVSPVYLAFVALPSLLPLAAARPGLMRLVVLLVMTAVAAIAGVLVATNDDAQAGLAVFLVPYVALPLSVVLWLARAVWSRWRAPPADGAEPSLATPSDRLAALVVDVAIMGALLVVPLTAMSHARQEIAAGILGVATGTAYLTAFVVLSGRTLGQRLLRLAVVDAEGEEQLGVPRAAARSLVVVLEVVATATVLLAPIALAELLSVYAIGRSLTDRLLGTSVVSTR